MTVQTENKAIAVTISLFIHLILFIILFYFILKTPNPPLGSGQGVVLNLGYVDEGTGETHTLNEPNESTINEENKPSDNSSDIAKPNTEETEKQNSSTETENLVTSNDESDVQSENKTQAIKEFNEKSTTNEKIKETKSEPTLQTKNSKTIDANALYGKTGTSIKGGNNNGDKDNKVGDQGDPNGDINAKALYGNAGTGGEGQGGSGGSSLDLAGWRWDKIPKVKDENEDDNGKIVFQITIDSEGEIINIKTLEKTVGPNVEKLYKEAVEKLSFSKTDNKIPASTSTGKITFIIKSK